MARPVGSVLIVGGGTAGWITASYLARFLDPAKCTVTLVESRVLGTIGVGEATVPPLVALLRVLGIDEDDFLVRCEATYKLGIRFDGWRQDEVAVWHPFGQVGAPIDGLPLFHHWLRQTRLGRDVGHYTSYSLQALLGEMGRAPRSPGQASVVTTTGAYAYHLDAKLFAAYLSGYATQRGVRHVIDDVSAVRLDERGFIAAVDTVEHGALSADLYVDCTGFAGVLIERALGDGHVDWSDLLLCDSAAVLQLPRDAQMAPFTRAAALQAGWAWRIPLAQRVGCGYVYSSRFVSHEDAARQLVAHAGAGPQGATPGRLAMRVGRREHFWVRNCVAVGLSAGFLEPLESTGIYLIQKGVELLLDHFPDCDFDPVLAQHYTRQLGAEFEHVRDFIVMHYLLGSRKDAFWEAARSVAVPESLARTLELYDHTGVVDWEREGLFRDPSFYCLASGFGRLPRTHHPMADQLDGQRALHAMSTLRKQHLALASSLPSHEELIAALHAAAGRA